MDQMDDSDIDLMLCVTEALPERKEREIGKLVIDVDSAWRDFQKYFNTPDSTGRSLYPVDKAAPSGGEADRSPL